MLTSSSSIVYRLVSHIPYENMIKNAEKNNGPDDNFQSNGRLIKNVMNFDFIVFIQILYSLNSHEHYSETTLKIN